MSKKVLVVVGLVFLFVYGLVLAGDLHARISEPADPRAAMEAAKTKAKALLAAKEWTVYVTPEVGGGGVEMDVLTFTDMQVLSQNLAAKGYPGSNYDIHFDADGTTVWETMKTDLATMNKVFVRGEMSRAGDMRGAFYMRPKKGNQTGFAFSTVMPQAASAVGVTETVVTQTSTKKSRK